MSLPLNPGGAGQVESIWKNIRRPGLTEAAGKIDVLLSRLPQRWDVFRYKKARTFLWVVFVGGTGTGKSTIFNALCGKDLSETGVERPKTFGPIAYVHRELAVERGFPFNDMPIRRIPPEAALAAPHGGAPGELQLLEHEREDFSHLALVDTPDVDSLELRNREMVEDLYLLADIVIFVTSQEKYADDVPFQFLARICAEGKPFILLLNKAESAKVSREVEDSLSLQGIRIPDERFISLPYLSSHSFEALLGDDKFKGFLKIFMGMSAKAEAPGIIHGERIRSVEELRRETRRFVELLDMEHGAARKWLDHLEVFYQANSRKLFEQQEGRMNEDTREYLQQEVRRLYSKYDVLGKPRRLISQVILGPLQALGIVSGKSRETREEALLRIRRKIDMEPIRSALEGFNRAVLEKLSPTNPSSPLYVKLRDPAVILTGDEVRNRVWEEQERLVLWLEQTFKELAQGIPKTKEWGIYTTSIIWGGLILSMEAVVGGGIHVIEAVLDSAIAPFVTKGAVELFAYHELQRVARELAEKYREGLVSIIRSQRDRYVQCLRSSTMTPETLGELHALARSLDRPENL